MKEIWENIFDSGEPIWGNEPSNSAIISKDFFLQNNVSNVLIPGIGYGRNATVFLENNINVTGIEISKNAIEIAKKTIHPELKIHQGSVLDMPFDNQKYDGIFCYSLLHLFDTLERKEFIKHCYEQLTDDGYMFFTVISVESYMYGLGNKIGKNRFQLSNDLNVFFFDENAIINEFENYGLVSFEPIDEPIKFKTGEAPLKSFLIKCHKDDTVNDKA